MERRWAPLPSTRRAERGSTGERRRQRNAAREQQEFVRDDLRVVQVTDREYVARALGGEQVGLTYELRNPALGGANPLDVAKVGPRPARIPRFPTPSTTHELRSTVLRRVTLSPWKKADMRNQGRRGREPKVRCPECHDQSLEAVQKLSLGLGRVLPCRNCKVPLTLNEQKVRIGVAAYGVLLLGTLTPLVIGFQELSNLASAQLPGQLPARPLALYSELRSLGEELPVAAPPELVLILTAILAPTILWVMLYGYWALNRALLVVEAPTSTGMDDVGRRPSARLTGRVTPVAMAAIDGPPARLDAHAPTAP